MTYHGRKKIIPTWCCTRTMWTLQIDFFGGCSSFSVLFLAMRLDNIGHQDAFAVASHLKWLDRCEISYYIWMLGVWWFCLWCVVNFSIQLSRQKIWEIFLCHFKQGISARTASAFFALAWLRNTVAKWTALHWCREKNCVWENGTVHFHKSLKSYWKSAERWKRKICWHSWLNSPETTFFGCITLWIYKSGDVTRKF
jgi:hypothetical protein